MMRPLQTEIYDWHRRNYPKDDIIAALLGVQEELGELARAQLKQDGGIRGTFEYWQEEKCKEIGDVLIGLLNIAEHYDVDVEIPLASEVSIRPYTSNNKSFLLSSTMFLLPPRELLLVVGIVYSRVVEAEINFHNKQFVEDMLNMTVRTLVAYCYSLAFDPIQLLTKRWATISQRDFISNPQTGGREKEV